MTGYTYAAVAALFLFAVVSEIRLRRIRRADRARLVRQLALVVGIAPTIKVARALHWIGEGDVRSDGDTVEIRMRKRWRLRRE